MTTIKTAWICALAVVFLIQNPASAQQTDARKPECSGQSQFTFSWQFVEGCDWSPRGGITTGAKITVDPNPHSGWLSLRAAGLSPFERDRRAILAMAGPYRTSFDFIEVAGYVAGFVPDKPYQSWGTEYVYVLEDRGDFISLQHVMVMYFVHQGEVSAPFVMKHWRQDWQYEKNALLEYQGNNTWVKNILARDKVAGTWSQAVYQVDDSPRYESYGRWEHKPGFSSWKSEKTWRPLPRREFSVRDDYQLLEGFNRHTIVPNGWIQEEENHKLVLGGSGPNGEQNSYLAKELGVNRYVKIIDHDFSAGHQYMKRSGEFWRDVRAEWSDVIARYDTLVLKKKVSGQRLFDSLFRYADTLQSESYDDEKGRAFVANAIDAYVTSED